MRNKFIAWVDFWAWPAIIALLTSILTVVVIGLGHFRPLMIIMTALILVTAVLVAAAETMKRKR